MLKSLTRPAVVCALWLVATTASAQTTQSPEVAAKIEGKPGVSAGLQLEGPTEGPDGSIYFTDLDGDRILRMSPDGKVTTFKQPANSPNGLVFDTQYRLLAAERGDKATNTPPRITRTDLKTGRVEVLADLAKIGGPNDVTFDGRGRIYFSAGGGIHRIDTDGKVTQILGDPITRGTNGLIISPDDRILYVAEAGRTKESRRRMQAFDLSPEGTASNPRVFKEFYPGRSSDGISIDVEGNVYVAAGLNRPRTGDETLDVKAGIYIFSPKAELIQFIPITVDDVRNNTFAGPDLKTLYVTAGDTLFRITGNKIAGTRR